MWEAGGKGKRKGIRRLGMKGRGEDKGWRKTEKKGRLEEEKREL